MKRLLIAAAFALLATTAHAHVKNVPQECVGTLTLADGEYRLADASPLKGKSLWCDALIVDPLLARVLRVCPVGTLCRIKGQFSGHGEFAWTKISRITSAECDA